MLLDINPIFVSHPLPDDKRVILGTPYSSYNFGEDIGFPYNTQEGSIGVYKNTWNPNTVAPNFWDIIKNQVHIFPALKVDFGLVLSQQEIEYYIWNAWTDKSATIKEPVLVGDFGTTFVFYTAGDFTLQPGYGTGGILTVFVEGPISSATDFQIEVTVDGMIPLNYLLETKATRIIVFPFWADWNDPVKFKMGFSTVMTKDIKNREQRRPLITKPQRSISFSHVEKFRGMISNALNFAGSKTIGVPILQEIFHVSDITDGMTTVHMHGAVSDHWNLNRYCDYICLIERTTNKLVAKKIVSRTADKIVVENPILEEFPNISDVYGFPMIIGYFKSAKPKVLSGKLLKWSMELEEMRGENQPPLVGVPALPSSLSTGFDWEDTVGFEQKIYRDIGEFLGTAQLIYQKFPYGVNHPQSFSGTFKLKTKQEIYSFLDFICGSKGRVKQFEYLWPVSGFNVIRGEYQGVNQLRVQNNAFAEQFSGMVNKKIRLRYRGYTLETSISGVSTNQNYTTITMLNPTTFQIFDEDCDNVYIEQYKNVRFDLDEFTLEFTSGNTAKINIRFAEVYV